MARRLLGKGYRNLKLRTLEKEVLGFYRYRDLPGSEAPEAYFTYLESAEEDGLQGVLEHNLVDIVSLPALAAELSFRMEAPRRPEEHKARCQLQARQSPTLELLAELEEILGQQSASAREWLELARLWRKLGQQQGQLRALEAALTQAPYSVVLLEELAKWYEHRGKDPAKALEMTERALQFARATERVPLQHRERRLQRALSTTDR
jgi:hypothetical protein